MVDKPGFYTQIVFLHGGIGVARRDYLIVKRQHVHRGDHGSYHYSRAFARGLHDEQRPERVCRHAHSESDHQHRELDEVRRAGLEVGSQFGYSDDFRTSRLESSGMLLGDKHSEGLGRCGAYEQQAPDHEQLFPCAEYPESGKEHGTGDAHRIGHEHKASDQGDARRLPAAPKIERIEAHHDLLDLGRRSLSGNQRKVGQALPRRVDLLYEIVGGASRGSHRAAGPVRLARSEIASVARWLVRLFVFLLIRSGLQTKKRIVCARTVVIFQIVHHGAGRHDIVCRGSGG